MLLVALNILKRISESRNKSHFIRLSYYFSWKLAFGDYLVIVYKNWWQNLYSKIR